MAKYFAQYDNQNIVQRVIVADSLEWCEQNLGGMWKETFIDKKDHNYAGIGHTYISVKQNFASPKPFNSWHMDENCKWHAPVEPTKELQQWDESKQKWIDKKTS